MGRMSAFASSDPSEEDIKISDEDLAVDNYVISKAAGTVTHYKGKTTSTMDSEFFYNTTAKAKQEQ